MARDIITVQMIVSGRVTDAITGSAPRAVPAISLVRAADGRPVPGVGGRVRPDGFFSFHADPARALPPAAISLRIEVTAKGYRPARVPVEFSAADLARVDRPLDLPEPAEVQVIGGVPVRRDIALDPLPVALSGRVAEADDRGRPIPGASVELTAPGPMGPVTTDEDGYFTLSPLPVAESVTLSISAPGHDPLSVDLAVDFRNPINRGSFALEPS